MGDFNVDILKISLENKQCLMGDFNVDIHPLENKQCILMGDFNVDHTKITHRK